MDKTERLQALDHGGVRVHLLDFSNISNVEEAVAVVDYCTDQLAGAAPSSQRFLYDLHNCIFTKVTLAAMERFYAATGRGVVASAVVGADGMMKIVVTTSAKQSPTPVRQFDDRATALAWLAEQQ